MEGKREKERRAGVRGRKSVWGVNDREITADDRHEMLAIMTGSL